MLTTLYLQFLPLVVGGYQAAFLLAWRAAWRVENGVDYIDVIAQIQERQDCSDASQTAPHHSRKSRSKGCGLNPLTPGPRAFFHNHGR